MAVTEVPFIDLNNRDGVIMPVMEKWWASEAAMLEMLQKRVEDYGSQRKVARLFGVSDAFLCDVLKRRRAVGPTIAASFGYEPITVYVKKGREQAQHNVE